MKCPPTDFFLGGGGGGEGVTKIFFLSCDHFSIGARII